MDVIELTQKLVGMNTINPPGNERQCAEFLGGMLKEAGFQVVYHEFGEKRSNLVAKFPVEQDGYPICFSGHLDTVPLGSNPWIRNPFAGNIRDGKLYGRGASDMKGAVAAMVLAAIRIAGHSDLKRGLTLILTAGEETGNEGAYYLTNLDTILGRAGGVIVGEPTSNQPLIGHKGCLWIKAETTGTSAHGSSPELGENAIHKAVDAIMKLREFDFGVEAHPIFGEPSLNIGIINGGGSINTVPDRASIGIDIRSIPDSWNRGIFDRIQTWLGDDIFLTKLVDVEGIATDPENGWVKQVFEIAGNYLGETPEPRSAAYFTDASALTPALGNPPTIILGPGDADMAHKTDEYCLVSNIREAFDMYFEIAREYCMTT